MVDNKPASKPPTPDIAAVLRKTKLAAAGLIIIAKNLRGRHAILQKRGKTRKDGDKFVKESYPGIHQVTVHGELTENEWKQGFPTGYVSGLAREAREELGNASYNILQRNGIFDRLIVLSDTIKKGKTGAQRFITYGALLEDESDEFLRSIRTEVCCEKLVALEEWRLKHNRITDGTCATCGEKIPSNSSSAENDRFLYGLNHIAEAASLHREIGSLGLHRDYILMFPDEKMALVKAFAQFK